MQELEQLFTISQELGADGLRFLMTFGKFVIALIVFLGEVLGELGYILYSAVEKMNREPELVLCPVYVDGEPPRFPWEIDTPVDQLTRFPWDNFTLPSENTTTIEVNGTTTESTNTGITPSLDTMSTTVEVNDTTLSLDTMSIRELKQLASQLKVPRYSRLTKTQLIQTLTPLLP